MGEIPQLLIEFYLHLYVINIRILANNKYNNNIIIHIIMSIINIHILTLVGVMEV